MNALSSFKKSESCDTSYFQIKAMNFAMDCRLLFINIIIVHGVPVGEVGDWCLVIYGEVRGICYTTEKL